MTPASSTDGQIALITGASGGIGAALSREIASDGFDVILTARRTSRLKDLAGELEDQYGVSALVIPKDLADPDAPRDLYHEVQNRGIHVHTLVNLAGFPVYGRFHETSFEEELSMMQVSMVALTHLTKLFVTPMVERGDGAILNMASVAAHVPLPRLAVYGATKAYVLSFSEAIAHELDDEGIQVTTVCPASVDTEIFEASELGQTKLAAGSLNDPESVATAAWQGLKAGDRLVRPSIRAKLIPQLPRILTQKKMTAMGADRTKKTSE